MPDLPHELPDLTALSHEDLDQHLADTVAAFETKKKADAITVGDMDELRTLAANIKALRAEKQTRIAAAVEAQAEIDALSAEVLDAPADASVEPETVIEPDLDDVTAAPDDTTESVSAAVAVRRPPINLAAIRRTPQPMPPAVRDSDPSPAVELRASVDMPGHAPGETIDMAAVTEGVIRRANSLKTAGGAGTGIVATYSIPFARELTVQDPGSLNEGSLAVIQAANQRRLNGGDLVASGGWCAPSETVYDIADMACPDMLWDAPEIQLSRGGLRFFQTPLLDVAALTWIHTEANDIAGDTKPCFTIPCPAPVEVRCDAIGVCLEAGILTQRFFPELVSWYVRNAMVAHEIRLRAAMYERARNAATAVTVGQTFGTFPAVFGAVALQVADMVERLSLCERIGVEVVFPWWVKNMFLADIARREGKDIGEVDAGYLTRVFAELGAAVRFARGLTPDVPTNIGGATAATVWPADMEFLLYPAGTFQIGRGAEVNLGVVHDSAKFSTNDYTAVFMEECVALVTRNAYARRVTVPICADGSVGPRATVTCPVA